MISFVSKIIVQMFELNGFKIRSDVFSSWIDSQKKVLFDFQSTGTLSDRNIKIIESSTIGGGGGGGGGSLMT